MKDRMSKDDSLASNYEAGNEQEPDGRIERQIEDQKEGADGGNVADPPERAAEINEADKITMTDRLPLGAFAAGNHPPRRDKGDPAAGGAGKGRETGDKKESRKGAPPPTMRVQAIKHAPSCQEFGITPIV